MTLDTEVAPVKKVILGRNAAQVYYDLVTAHFIDEAYRITVTDVVLFGEIGQGGKPGVIFGITNFLKFKPEWVVVAREDGAWLLSRWDADKKQPPGILRQAMNFTKALTAHVADGLSVVPQAVWETRIELCVVCDKRYGDVCGECGCDVETKASWASSQCPLNPPKWGKHVGDQPEPDPPA